MRSSIAVSVALHVAVVVLGVVGLPSLRRPPDLETPPVVVELVTISDETNVPTRPKDPEPPKEEPKAEPPKPTPPPQRTETPPPPPPKPEPMPELAAVPPPEPKKEAPKKEEPKKEEPKPRPPEELAKVKAKKKPSPPKEDFDAVLKNLAKTLPQQKAEPKAEAKKAQPSFDDLMAKAIPSNRRTIGDPTKPISMTQKDALQNEFNKAMQRCWNIPAGAKDAANLIIVVNASFAPDGTIVTARSDDVNSSDPFRRAAAESAVRALRSCSPYSNLPAIAAYEQWRDIELRFNPKEILGG